MRGPLHIVRIHRDRHCLVLTCKHGVSLRFRMDDPRFAVAALRIALRPLKKK